MTNEDVPGMPNARHGRRQPRHFKVVLPSLHLLTHHNSPHLEVLPPHLCIYKPSVEAICLQLLLLLPAPIAYHPPSAHQRPHVYPLLQMCAPRLLLQWRQLLYAPSPRVLKSVPSTPVCMCLCPTHLSVFNILHLHVPWMMRPPPLQSLPDPS